MISIIHHLLLIIFHLHHKLTHHFVVLPFLQKFFITCAECSWLDGKHVVFGRVLDGMKVVKMIENVPTVNGKNSERPSMEAVITECLSFFFLTRSKQNTHHVPPSFVVAPQKQVASSNNPPHLDLLPSLFDLSTILVLSLFLSSLFLTTNKNPTKDEPNFFFFFS